MNSSTSWNITDASILIPVVNNNNDSLDNNMIVGELGEGTDISAASLSHALLIGLNKSFFGEAASSKDVIFVHNNSPEESELAADGMPVECVITEDHKSDGSYLISFVDSNKESNSWDNTHLRSVRKAQKDEFNSSACTNVLFSTKGGTNYKIALNEDAEVGPTEEDVEKSLLTTFVKKEDSGSLTEAKVDVACEKSSLSEHSLPLKKKAKMKDSTEKNNDTLPNVTGESMSNQKKKVCTVISQQEMKLLRDEVKRKRAFVRGKRKCCFSDTELSETEDNAESIWPVELDLDKIQTMDDLVGQLKDLEFIDQDFAQLILRGIVEMKVDILQELKTSFSAPSNVIFSNELLSFAFLLYYHKKKVYHYMSHSWKTAWPSIPKLMEWKNLVNSVPKKQTRKRRILNKKV